MNEHRGETVTRTLSGRIERCLTGGLWILKLQVGHCLGQVRHCLVGPDIVRWEVYGNGIFSQNLPFLPKFDS
jgi:hypothetical protein